MVDKKKVKEPKAEKPKKPRKPKSDKPKIPPKNGKGGRKPYYEILDIRNKLESIRGWCKEGSTDVEISKMLGISTTLYYEWKKDKVEFAETIKKGKDIANGELLNSAFKQSTGYYVPTVVVVKLKKVARNADGSILLVAGKPIFEEMAEGFPTTEYIPPNPTMNIFMLKNRMPEKYKDKHEVEHSGAIKLEDLMG